MYIKNNQVSIIIYCTCDPNLKNFNDERNSKNNNNCFQFIAHFITDFYLQFNINLHQSVTIGLFTHISVGRFRFVYLFL